LPPLIALSLFDYARWFHYWYYYWCYWYCTLHIIAMPDYFSWLYHSCAFATDSCIHTLSITLFSTLLIFSLFHYLRHSPLLILPHYWCHYAIDAIIAAISFWHTHTLLLIH
jgi:hypothetical protein